MLYPNKRIRVQHYHMICYIKSLILIQNAENYLGLSMTSLVQSVAAYYQHVEHSLWARYALC